MVEIRDRDTIITTPVVSDGGAGAAAMVILGLILVAVIGYCMYAFGGTNTVIERDNTTTIQQPAPAPAPAPVMPAPVMPAPAAPSGDASGSNQ
jgi:hypothetical protein